VANLKTIIRDAAWPAIAVLVAHAILGETFGHEPVVDPVMHFLGGCACAYLVIGLVRLFPEWSGQVRPLILYLLAFGLTSSVAVFWELGEFLSDIYLGTRAHTSIASTLRDLLNGLLGALALVAAHWLESKKRARQEPGSPP
jgi:hypothetical protein